MTVSVRVGFWFLMERSLLLEEVSPPLGGVPGPDHLLSGLSDMLQAALVFTGGSNVTGGDGGVEDGLHDGDAGAVPILCPAILMRELMFSCRSNISFRLHSVSEL